MVRILLVRPGAGAPDLVPIEVWQALTTARAYAPPGDPLAARLEEAGYAVTSLEEAAPAALSPQPPAAVPGRNLLAHAHGEISDGARVVAARLRELADEHGTVAYILDDDVVARAVMADALEHGSEVEFVMGRAPRGHTLLELVRVMARLRGPGGCPWDAEQTHQTLVKHLLDETYELLEAIESGSEADIAEELGDVLLQVVFHAQMGTDAGAFDIDDVARGLIDKLVRRHPHVFGDVTVSGAREVVENWDAIKSSEKQRDGALDGIPASLPALAFAQKMQRRAAAAGFDFAELGAVVDKIAEEAGELARETDPAGRERELGDLLFSLVMLGRRLDVDAESALRRAAQRFAVRFRAVEDAARARGVALADLDDDALGALWREAKSS